MPLTDGVDLTVRPKPAGQPRASEEVIDLPPHYRLSRRRLLFINIYPPLSKLRSSGTPVSSASAACDCTACLTGLDIVKREADSDPFTVE